MNSSESTWHNDNIQFPRLLSEIFAVGLSKDQIQLISDSMDITPRRLNSLLRRADLAWEKIKANRHDPK